MKDYIVGFRDKNGGLVYVQYQAADRNALFARLAEEGRHAVDVREGVLPPPRKQGGAPVGRILLLVGVAAAAALGCWFFLSGPSDGQGGGSDAGNRRIADVNPSGGPKAAGPTAGGGSAGADVGGVREGASSNGVETVVRKPVDPTHVGRLVKRAPRKKLFKHMCDSQIARVLAIEPGGLILGTLNYHKNRFAENFAKSLKDAEPVELKADDTEEERELKLAVIDARKELKAAYDRGEDIAEIMQESEAELHRMQGYRMELRSQLAKVTRDPEYSKADLEDFTTAVNEMLAAKGQKPLKCPKLWAIKARLKNQKNPDKEEVK